MLPLFIPVPLLNVFLVLPRHPPFPDSLPIHHPMTELHRYFHPILPPLLVLDRLSTRTRLNYRRPPTPVSALVALPPLTCSPSPCWPLQPHTASPFLPRRSLSGRPPFANLGVIQAPLSTPVVSPF